MITVTDFLYFFNVICNLYFINHIEIHLLCSIYNIHHPEDLIPGLGINIIITE